MTEEFGKREKKQFSKTDKPERGASNRKEKGPSPPRVLLCHCQKCDNEWTVHMQLVAEAGPKQLVIYPGPPKPKTRGRVRNQKKLVWIFEPESFEVCNNCGARSINIQNAKTDLEGRVKLHLASRSPNSLSLEDDSTTEEDDNV